MNVYDFDETIYDGDSTRDFYFFCLKRYPKILLLLPMLAFNFAKYVFGFFTKTQFKEKFYKFLTFLPDTDKEVSAFWEKNKNKIKKWYLKQKKDNDLIISASPEFLLSHVCKEVGVSLMASRVNAKSGETTGENCYGEEKVKRLGKGTRIKNFYSDSFSDEPLAKLAENAFIVKKDELHPWNEYKPSALEKIKKSLFSVEFFGFLVIGCINTVNGVLFSMLYSMLLGANAAFAAGYITSLLVSYLLNSTLVFKEKLETLKCVKFCISYIPNFIVQNLCVMLFYNLLHFPKLITYALAAVIGVPLTFLFIKIFAFKKKSGGN